MANFCRNNISTADYLKLFYDLRTAKKFRLAEKLMQSRDVACGMTCPKFRLPFANGTQKEY
jgi:hypothetical protein